MIKVSHLSKHFRVAQPGRGPAGKVKRLFVPQYKTIRAVDDVSFQIQEGEIVGYLGPNGAGKSTTIKLLTGVLYPTAGSLQVNGLVPHENRTQNAYNIGVVYGQRSQLDWDLPLIDSFDVLAAMYKLPRQRYRDHLDFLVELMDMKAFVDQPVRKLSLGQKMRGDLAASLLHEPSILYLDEPTIGLDVVSKNRVLQLLRDLNVQKRTTIVFTTHNLSDVERICPRIMIIDKGRIILDATQGEILEQFGRQRLLVVEFEHGIQDIVVPNGEVIKEEDNKLWIAFDREQISAFDLVRTLGTDQGIKDISIQEASIESIVAQIYENGLEEAA
ncbi:MAG: ATP-binding cassette domain-containing protein [Anaerolineae bacterium]|nr:ATP-binding cassette domain-containing protein [Anaerolineae bacterium]